MKRTLLAISILSTAFVANAQIVTHDEAQVTGVTPIVEQIRQRGQCQQVPTGQQQQGGNTGQAIIGAIIGGAVGSRFGQGDGRDAMIAAGAATGAVWGSGQPTSGGTTMQCEPDQMVERTRGYRVTYTYQGYSAVTTMQQQPGPTIRVTITVTADNQMQQQRQPQYQQQQYQPQYQQRY